MSRIEKIIVGVEMPEQPWAAANLSATCRIALRQAFDVAKAQRTDVTLVTVLPEPSAGLFGSEEEAVLQGQKDAAEAEQVLGQIKDQYAADSGLAVDTLVATGQPWFELLRASGPARENLIICGVRDKGAVSRLLFGSTGIKLLRNAPCPVWLVKPRIDDDADLDVLAATDLTEIGEEVIEFGVALGQSLPVRLTVLNAVDDDLDRRMARTGVDEEELADYRKQLCEAAESRMHEQLALTDYRTVEKGVKCQVAEGTADVCILEAIEQLDIDLLIMATAARGGIPGMLFGNTAERLLPELPCSILALKPDDFVCPVDLKG